MNKTSRPTNTYKNLSQEELIQLVVTLTNQVQLLSEQVKLLTQRQYGRKTEEASSLQLQMDLEFNEAEAIQDSEEPEPTLEKAAPKKKQKGKRKNDLVKVTNHRDVNVEIKEEDLISMFGKNGWKRLPDETYSKLEHHPASFEAVTYHIAVYAGKDNQTIVRAERPIDVMPKSIATPSLLASIIFAKYVNAVPLYRQEKTYEQGCDIHISRTTMANWCIKSADILKPYYNLLKEQMINEHIINADETPFLLSKDGREAGSKSYMWVYRAGAHHEEDKKIVLYDYQPTRRADHPREFLNGFKGIVMSDGYQVYHKLEKERPDELVVAGCWAHAKRKFSEVVKANNKNNKVGNSLSSQAIQMITKIFHETNLLDDLPYEE